MPYSFQNMFKISISLLNLLTSLYCHKVVSITNIVFPTVAAILSTILNTLPYIFRLYLVSNLVQHIF